MRREDVAAAVRKERLSLADQLTALTPEQWDQSSLCAGWRIRDVVAHLTLGVRVRAGRAVMEFARARGNVNRMIHDTAVRRADAVTPDQLITDLRAAAESERHPPGTSHLDPLADVLVHGQDIAMPLGIPRAMPVEAAAVAAQHDWSMGFPFNARRRLHGLRLVATDAEWSAGDGLQIEGPIGALLLVVTGRPAGLARLSGPGVAELSTRNGFRLRAAS